MANSLEVAFAVVVLNLLVGVPAAYAIPRDHLPSRNDTVFGSASISAQTERARVDKVRLSRGTEGLQTRRWSKPDSNSRSHLRRCRCEAQEYGRRPTRPHYRRPRSEN
jgi:hypothetical protein